MTEHHHHHHGDHTHDHGGHDHGGHNHGVGGHSHAPASFGGAFAIGITLNLTYVAAEAFYGVASHSLALLADAGHNVGDVLGLAAAWLAATLAKRGPTKRFTYGLRGSSILAALGNAVALLIITGALSWEAIRRLVDPQPAAGLTIMIVAGVGIVINGATALMFMRGRKQDLNLRGAFTHMAADALLAAGVVVAGGLILWTHWLWLDPAISLLVSGLIVAGTWSLLRDSMSLALDAVPPGIDCHQVETYLGGLPGVTEVHDLHVWGMSTTETALTAHLVRPGCPVDDELLHRACTDLKARFGIGHATLQVESGEGEQDCHLASAEVI